MTFRILGVLVAAGVAVLSFGRPVVAQQAQTAQMQSATANVGSLYFGASAGAIIFDGLKATASAPGAHGSATLTFKPGAAGTVLFGYHYDDQFAAEIEGGYGSADMDKVSASASVAGVGSASGTATAKGNLETWVGFVNGIWTPVGNSGFSPYLGAGIGVAASTITAKSLSGPGGTVTFTGGNSGSETDFAANLIAGLNYAITPQVSLGARYRFIWINTSQSQTLFGTRVHLENETAHLITANVTMKF
jgi:opacity protein-like surface antigen